MAENIDLGIVGIKNMGEYNSQTNYEKLNVVTYQGSTYCALKNTTGNLPTNTEYWQLYAEKGGTGPQGPKPVKGEDYFTEEDITDIENDLKPTITSDVSDEVISQLGSLVSATPLVASSVSEMIDTTRIYVNTTNGQWYWYDGDSWEIGGTYQSSGIENKSIKGIKTNFFTSENKIHIEDGTYSKAGVTATVINGIITLSGTATSTNYLPIPITNNEQLNGAYLFSCFSNYISGLEYRIITNPAQANVSYKLNINHNYYFNNKILTSFDIRLENGTVTDNVIIKPMMVLNNEYNKLTSFKSYNESLLRNDNIKEVNLSKSIDEDKTTFLKPSINIIDPRKLINGYATNMKIETGELNIIDPEGSYVTYLLYASEDTTYTFYPRIRLYGTLINGVYTHNENEISGNRTITVSKGTRLNVAFYKSDLPNIMGVIGSSIDEFVPFEYSIDYLKNYNKNDIENLYNSNILYNKKYVALGDSFTHGDFTNAPTDNYHITNGLYNGQYKVYPYIIGNRNLMTILNLARNGMTLTNINGRSNNWLSDDVLANIPSDADYITIKIGINDDNHNAPLGTIDSNDSTTFYGSFNRVMTYLINNYKNAKIGIIVSNGIDDIDYINATINIAKKYGVSYLNETTDEKVPLLIRTLRSDVDASIKTLRKNEWYVSTTAGSVNPHPNAKCHEYESTIVENFLRSL